MHLLLYGATLIMLGTNLTGYTHTGGLSSHQHLSPSAWDYLFLP